MSLKQGTLDDHLPVYRHTEVHEVTIAAAPERVMRAVKELRGRDVALTYPLLALRYLPAKLLGRPVPPSDRDRTIVEAILRGGFILLEETPGEMIVGVAGRFWQLTSGMVPLAGPADFAAFQREGYAKAVMNFTVEPQADGKTCLRTETRILPLGREAARRFGLYWLFVRPGSGLIRWIWLLAIKRKAEATA